MVRSGSFKVGEWVVEPALDRISRKPETVSLRPQVMELLVYLARRNGQVVGMDDILDDLWAGKVVGSNAVYNCVAELRRALADSQDPPSYVETIPKRGYRLVAPVSGIASTPIPGNGKVRKVKIGGAALLIGLLAAIIISYLPPKSQIPTVSGYTQLTKTQLLFPPPPSPFPLVADASRIYTNNWNAGRISVRQMSQAGGEAVVVPTPFDDPQVLFNPLAMNPDGSELLITAWIPGSPDYANAIWLLPVVGGDPRYLVDGCSASYSPDGRYFVYADCNGNVTITKADLSDARKLVTVPGKVYWPNISPDGQKVRFNMTQISSGGRGGTRTIWEVSADGSGLRPMLPGWEFTDHCCGNWTSDGEYYVFQATHDNRTQIWAAREQENYSGKSEGGPIPITTGALDFRRPTIAADGKSIFAVGWQLRGEVVRFNKESDSFETLPGFESLSAEWLAFSSGGQQVAYVSYPQGDLWESRVDGTGRQQLTFPPMQAVAPAWSPSGEQLAFEGRLPGDSWRIYLVPKKGGKPEPITSSDREQLSPTWSQDGRLLAFTEEGKDRIQILDLASREVSELKGSEGLRRPLWSPNGQYLLAHLDADLMLYDFAAGRQEVLLKNVIAEGYSWTPGSQYITYYEPFWRATERWTYRVNINEKMPEKIAVVGGAKVRPTWGVFRAWVGSAPDGAPLMLRDQSIHHIYALDWQPD